MNGRTTDGENTDHRSDYEAFEQSSVENRRLLRRAELIFDFTEGIAGALKREKLQRKDLAERLGKTKGFVSQILSGGRNLTLNTIADVADALGYGIRVIFYHRNMARVPHQIAVREFHVISGGRLQSMSWSTEQPKFQTTESALAARPGTMGIEYSAAA